MYSCYLLFLIKRYYVKYKIFKRSYEQNSILLKVNKEVRWQLLQYHRYLLRVTVLVFKYFIFQMARYIFKL